MRNPLRAAALTAAAVAAGSLTLVAAPAANAAPPAGDTTISGVAQVDGVASAGIQVSLYEATAPYAFVGAATTDATGEYWFDLTTGGGSNGGYTSTGTTATSFKLGYYDGRALTGEQLPAQSEYYNDRYTLQGATAVARPAPATNATLATVSLTSYAGIKGTPSVQVPAGWTYSGTVIVLDADGNLVDVGSFDNAPGTTSTTESYAIDGLTPGETYYARFYATAQAPTGSDRLGFLSRFYGGATRIADAAPITLAPGRYAEGVQATLSSTFAPVEAPSIEGQVGAGRTVTADPGDWGTSASNHYGYRWFLNGAPVASGPTYTIDKGARGATLRVEVTNENLAQSAFNFSPTPLVGTATSAEVTIGYAVKLKAKAKRQRVLGATNAVIKGKVKVKAPKKKAAKLAKGKVVVYDVLADGTLVKVGKGRVVRGRLTAVAKRLDHGKHELAVAYQGSTKVAADTVTVKIKA
jgi:hypothetical protein